MVPCSIFVNKRRLQKLNILFIYLIQSKWSIGITNPEIRHQKKINYETQEIPVDIICSQTEWVSVYDCDTEQCDTTALPQSNLRIK